MRHAVMVVATALAAAVAGALPSASATGDATVVVRGAALPASAQSRLNLVGCADVFGRSAETPVPMIGAVPGGPRGKRSLGFDLVGGNAIGPVSYVSKVAATTVAGMSVYAPDGASGVAYAGYQPPGSAGTSLMWIGRADLAVPAGGPTWTSVDVTGLSYTWTLYDMSTQRPTGSPGGTRPLSELVGAEGGDGYGFYAIGFGCDGSPFNMDAWRIGRPGATTTYDFEGYRTHVSVAGPRTAVAPGAEVTLTGRVVDDQGAPVEATRAVLQAKQGNGPWEIVAVTQGSSLSAVVRPEKPTTYRWKVFDTPSAEGSESERLVVEVAEPSAPATSDPPATSDGDGEDVSPGPGEPTDQPSEQQPTQQPAKPAPTAPVEQVTTPPAEQVSEPTEPSAPATETTPSDAPAAPLQDTTQDTTQDTAEAPAG